MGAVVNAEKFKILNIAQKGKLKMNLKLMRDKINGSEPLVDGETKEMLIEQWKELHAQLESEKEADERNYILCEEVK